MQCMRWKRVVECSGMIAVWLQAVFRENKESIECYLHVGVPVQSKARSFGLPQPHDVSFLYGKHDCLALHDSSWHGVRVENNLKKMFLLVLIIGRLVSNMHLFYTNFCDLSALCRASVRDNCNVLPTYSSCVKW